MPFSWYEPALSNCTLLRVSVEVTIPLLVTFTTPILTLFVTLGDPLTIHCHWRLTGVELLKAAVKTTLLPTATRALAGEVFWARRGGGATEGAASSRTLSKFA